MYFFFRKSCCRSTEKYSLITKKSFTQFRLYDADFSMQKNLILLHGVVFFFLFFFQIIKIFVFLYVHLYPSTFFHLLVQFLFSDLLLSTLLFPIVLASVLVGDGLHWEQFSFAFVFAFALFQGLANAQLQKDFTMPSQSSVKLFMVCFLLQEFRRLCLWNATILKIIWDGLFAFAARVVTDRVSGYSKGFGFVRYATVEEAAAGIQGMDGKVSLH